MNTTMNEVMNEGITEGEKKMVRKAETLESLDELDLCARAKRYVKKRISDTVMWLEEDYVRDEYGRIYPYLTRSNPDIAMARVRKCGYTLEKYGTLSAIERYSLDSVISAGRQRGYILDKYGAISCDGSKSWTDFVVALDKAGLIRHDITEHSFLLGRIFCWLGCYHVYPSDIGELCMLAPVFDDYLDHSLRFNLGYEIFRNPTDEQYEIVKKHAKGCLSDREYSIFLYKTGLSDGKEYSTKEIAAMLGVTSSRVNDIIRKMKVKLNKCLKKMLEELEPTFSYFKLPQAAEETNRDAARICAELDELRQEPAVKRAMELEQELRKLQRLSERIATLMQATSLDA